MLMIGVSTEQNITNVLPAFHREFNTREVLLLETQFAQAKKWSEGLRTVLGGRGIRVDILDLSGIDTHITEIQRKLADRVLKYPNPILWNLGGGQKPQQLACWEVFKARSMRNTLDVICYANQGGGAFELWWMHEGTLQRSELTIETDLTLEEWFTSFGSTVVNEPTPLYIGGAAQKRAHAARDLLQFEEFRTYFHRLPTLKTPLFEQNLSIEDFKSILRSTGFKKEVRGLVQEVAWELLHHEAFNWSKKEGVLMGQNEFTLLVNTCIKEKGMFSEIQRWVDYVPDIDPIRISSKTLKRIIVAESIEINTSLLSSLSQGRYEKSAFYFEDILMSRVVSCLSSGNHSYYTAYGNVEVERGGQRVAEYDVLLMSKTGRIVALDAKTFDVDQKDIDARLYNLQQGAGYYRAFHPVLPIDRRDWTRSVLTSTLKSLPSRLQKRGNTFYVIDDGGTKPFWVHGSEGVSESQQSPGEGWVKCVPLGHLFQNNTA